jgi:O-antigen/teichoic acid export membrane protein
MASAPIALVLIFGGHWFLLLFGHGFTGGHTPLTVLCVGQLANAAIGPVGFLLIMTGHGKEAAIGIGIGVGANLLLSLLLIPLRGADGAAAASASSLIIWNTVLALFVRRRLSIAVTAFGRANPRCAGKDKR